MEPQQTQQDTLLRPGDAARRLGVMERTLEAWRYRGYGPRFVRLTARSIRYPLADLEAWVAERGDAHATG